MWTMIFFLWLVPVILVIVAAQRSFSGRTTRSTRERRVLLGKPRGAALSLWFWILITGFALGFFTLGVLEAVILLNLLNAWTIVAPLLTGTFAALLLVLLLRSRFAYRNAPGKAPDTSHDPQPISYSPDF